MQWVVIGGSYPGALAAWFKNLYPDLAVAAWASSAVINAIEDFKSFDHDIMIKTSASQDGCTATINAIT
jgi:pimeloyl-ACP methyl ester carboxylesterase